MTDIHVASTPAPKGLVLSPVKRSGLAEQMKAGLDAPICLTWELTYACNLQCVHCLSSSGRRDPRELTTVEAEGVIDELADLQVFYVNIGGGEPTIRPDFWQLVDDAVDHGVGVKVSTNGWLTFDTSYTSSSSFNYSMPTTSGPEDMIALFWDDLHYEVATHPLARVRVVVHSFSEREGWVGA